MLKLNAALKDYIWGGNNLKNKYGKSSDGPVAEAWELSTHPDGKSRVSGGEFDGMELPEVLKIHPEYCGPEGCPDGTLPVLFKLIDSDAPLSVQVHPDDLYARRVENSSGKTECWYILEAAEDACIYLGLNRDLSREAFEEKIRDGSLLSVLNRISVRPGEIYNIPAGTVHALGKGVTLAELQQNSNLTYRVYDYGRLGRDGKPRPLHIQKALDVIHLKKGIPDVPADSEVLEKEGLLIRNILRTDLFCLDRLELSGNALLPGSGSFRAMTCVDGNAVLSSGENSLNMQKGDTVFVCAGETVRLSGSASVLLYGPDRGRF